MTGPAQADPAIEMKAGARTLPVIFLGPSMPLTEARALLPADYRPPVRRGDLDRIGPDMLVAIIDGVFEQHLAVSPGEIHSALARGVRIVGGGSMGALRAAEVPGMTGAGRIFEWYRSRRIDRDDEVALIFDPRTSRPLSVPLVNIRYALDRLTGLGTINVAVAEAILAAAQRMSFKDRTYPQILAEAGLGGRAETSGLIAMLEAHDLKRSDAQVVIELVDRLPREAPGAAISPVRPVPAADERAETSNSALIWESGDRIDHDDLRRFLILTGRFDRLIRHGDGARPDARDGQAQMLLVEAVRRWGWLSAEETRVSLDDLGVPLKALNDACANEAAWRGTMEDATAQSAGPCQKEWRARLLLDGLALKRAALQIGSLRHFATRAGFGPLDEAEREEAREVWTRLNGVARFRDVLTRWEMRGFGEAEIEAAVADLARARRGARPLAATMRGNGTNSSDPSPGGTVNFPLASCLKSEGDPRFTWPLARAEAAAQDIAARIGITRIGMIGELGEFIGESIKIAQASRPGGSWSSSYGSGKARTTAGAVVGSVMEELEKFAQERFAPTASARGSFAELHDERPCIDPATLDLPYDSPWHSDLAVDWLEVDDLQGGGRLLMPLDPLRIMRGRHDICFSARGARKHLATNGLGAGFSREEACLHALCELVERHAQRLAELFLSNPGGIGPQPYTLIRPDALGAPVRRLAAELAHNAESVRLLDITSEITIPTFMATLVRDRQRAEGFGTHPNPAVAAEMALLEAAQTVSSLVAGGREDLSIHARSLGRHERPRPIDAADSWLWLDRDAVLGESPQYRGFVSNDVRDDLVWCLGRLRTAGFREALAVDLTPVEAAPAHVVRMIVPGLESNNPFHTGERARLVLAREFLPRWR